MWNEITNPSPNFNGATVEVWESISYSFPHFTGHAITYPCWDYKTPLHLDVVDRYLRLMGDKTNRFIPHESQVSIYHNQGVVDSLSRSAINTNKGVF